MDWLARELLTGFQKLLCLGLERTPATDLIEGTVMTWHEALTISRKWEAQRDQPRIRKAFVTLAASRTSWPAIPHFLDALPPVEQGQLGYDVKPVSRAEAESRMAEIMETLRTSETSDDEQELDRKTLAAGGGCDGN